MWETSRLETERLLLRSLADKDAISISKIAGDFRIADTTISIPHPYSLDIAKEYIAKQKTEQKKGYCFAFAIERKLESDFIGIAGIRDIDREHLVAELNYWLAVKVWGKGYMSEAIKPLLNFGFQTLSLNRIQAYHMKRNPASGKVLVKNGFKKEGLLRQRVKKWDKFEDVNLLSILREDWQANSI